MLFDVNAINNNYAKFRPCNCEDSDVRFGYYISDFDQVEYIFVRCESCMMSTHPIVRKINRTRLQDVDKVIEFWNNGQVGIDWDVSRW